MSNRRNKTEIAEAVARLQSWVKPGDTLFTILRHVSDSGMLRVVDVLKIGTREDGTPDVRTLAHNANEAGLASGFDDRRNGAKIVGCGMDVGFQLVYNIGRACFPEGFGTPCIHCGVRPETPDQAARMRSMRCRIGMAEGRDGQRIPTFAPGSHEFRGRNGDTSGWDADGGYALEQRWL